MKQLFLLAAILFSGQIFGQAWVPIGTKWVFQLPLLGTPNYQEYPVECTDTVEIDGKFYSKLVTEDPWSCAVLPFGNQPAFLRVENGKVFYRDGNLDKLLYDFNTPVGGSWQTEARFSPTQIITINVTVTGEDTINYFGLKRRGLFVEHDSPLYFANYIMEGIGSSMFLFPQSPACDPYVTKFLCFFDPALGTFGDIDCSVPAEDIFRKNPQIQAAPNPSSGKFIIDNQQVTSTSLLEIFSFSGNKIRAFLDPPAHFELDLGGEPAGVYVAKWTLSDGRFLVKKLVLK